jgi:hypothetical protein
MITVTMEMVDEWWANGCKGRDPRGVSPGLNWYYSYGLQTWVRV